MRMLRTNKSDLVRGGRAGMLLLTPATTRRTVLPGWLAASLGSTPVAMREADGGGRQGGQQGWDERVRSEDREDRCYSPQSRAPLAIPGWSGPPC